MSEMSRQEANLEIVNLILDIIENNPDWRFGQILYNIGVATHLRDDSEVTYDLRNTNIPLANYKDIFFEESTTTLERISSQR